MRAFDFSTRQWSYKASMRQKRKHPGVAAHRELLYVVGGTQGNGPKGGLNTMEVYDPATNRWDDTRKPLITARSNSVVVGYNGKIFVAGGMPKKWPALATTEVQLT